MRAPHSFVRPAERGRRVHFRGRAEPLAEAGELVPLDDYWQRRLAEGVVISCSPPATVAANAAPAPAADDEDEDEPHRGKRRKGKKDREGS